MSLYNLLKLQITQIRQGDKKVVARKLKRGLKITIKTPIYLFAMPFVLVIRLIRPLLLVRWKLLNSDRIGHFAANTEMYLCERDAGINVPKQRHIDLFYMIRPICNQQLATMWKRVLHVWPLWILNPISQLNRLIPGGVKHEIGNTIQSDRDVLNLMDRFPAHLQFTSEEDARGDAYLLAMGIPTGAPFVCLIARDSKYLDSQMNGNWDYHNYRDCNIQNYILAAEELADFGYFVIRMGAKVHEAIKSLHPKVIDYATNGMRSDFMDIFLCAKCKFFISTGEGLICIPMLFRRPIVVSNMVPLGYFFSYYSNLIGITKHHYSVAEYRELKLKEIFTFDVGFCLQTSDYESHGIHLIENTPIEIRDIVIEMVERLNDTWQVNEKDEALQKCFWEIFPSNAVDAYFGKPLHGSIRARFGAAFLCNNREWLR